MVEHSRKILASEDKASSTRGDISFVYECTEPSEGDDPRHVVIIIIITRSTMS